MIEMSTNLGGLNIGGATKATEDSEEKYKIINFVIEDYGMEIVVNVVCGSERMLQTLFL